MISLERLDRGYHSAVADGIAPGTQYVFCLDFTSHTDAALIEAVRRGRREEFAEFHWQGEPPDAQSEDTFLRSKLNHCLRQQEPHRSLLEFYQKVIRLRRTLPGLADRSKGCMQVRSLEESILQIRRWSEGGGALVLANFSDELRPVSFRVPAGEWRQVLDSAGPHWRGPGCSAPDCFQSKGEARLSLRPKSFALFQRLP